MILTLAVRFEADDLKSAEAVQQLFVRELRINKVRCEGVFAEPVLPKVSS